MKKNLKKLITGVAMAVMAFAFVGCSKKDDGKFDTIADYVKSEQIQNELNTLKQTYNSSQGMEINLFAEGDVLVYEYRYTTIEKVDGMAEALESAMKEQESVFVQTANSLKTVTNVKNPKVDIRYIDCKGVLIYSRQFSAK